MMEFDWLIILLLHSLVIRSHTTSTKTNFKSPLYSNQFAIHVPSGDHFAQKIAEKHGFIFHGQIGSLPNYYLIQHKNLKEKSPSISEEHHNLLKNEYHVHWFQQQHERRRKKRDNFHEYSTSPDFPPFFQEYKAQIHDLSSRHRGIILENIFTDPLFKEQWYLNGGAKDGFDMNLGPAWQKGYTGKGIVVSILDDGIQTNHPDLFMNYDHEASTDINDNDDDPMPRDNGDNKHGTRCAGEVAAVAFNHYCGVGVAYNASIGGVRMLDGSVNDVVEARALGLNPDHIDIYSASWGPEDDGKTVDGPGPLARRAFIYGVTSGRRGKGSIFVWASGNGGRHTDSCNCDGYTNSIFTLSISSATQGGYKPWYLEECSSTLASTYSSGTPGNDKSITTVDMDASLREDHICTVEHTGTSASAPLAAGIVALALEANPSLTWRDMQYLVVLTSRSEPLAKETGWILNGVKRKVSHKFGYGLMDAGAIVTLAEQWTNVPPQRICKSQEINEDRQIDPTYGYTLSVSMDANGCVDTLNEVRFLEHVQCKISLRFFPRGNLRLLLTSPMGTTSTLLFERPRDVLNSNFDDWPFLSVHFWGEKADGRWRLQVINAGSRHVNSPGILKKWQLIFYGTSSNPIRIQNHINPEPYAAASSRIETSLPHSQYLNPLLTNSLTEYKFHQDSVHSRTMNSISHNCDSQCDSQGCYGDKPTDCIKCLNYRYKETCVKRCPARTSSNSRNICLPCHESCRTCGRRSEDSCSSCAPGFKRVTDLSLCLQQCPEGYYENHGESTCLPCAANCASCSNSGFNCTSCEHHLLLHENQCLSACPLFTYETEDYSCNRCHMSCETCKGPYINQCITCKEGYFSINGFCRLAECPVGYNADEKRRECIPCPPGCSNCSNNGCSNCFSDWILSKDICIPKTQSKCKKFEFYGNGSCEVCHQSCITCKGPLSNDCITCKKQLIFRGGSCVDKCDMGFFSGTQGSRLSCIPCPHTCKECTSKANCTFCQEGLYLQNNECHASCTEGYYNDIGLCLKCSESCKTCSGPRGEHCLTCHEGWILFAGSCHPECPQGYFKSAYGCQKCHHYCRNCQGGGPDSCTSCAPYLMIQHGRCMACLDSQYYDPISQLCRNCHSDCEKCIGPSRLDCLVCATSLRLNKTNNQCVPCCKGHPKLEGCCSCENESGDCSIIAEKRRVAILEIPAFGTISSHTSRGNQHEIKENGRSPIFDENLSDKWPILAFLVLVGIISSLFCMKHIYFRYCSRFNRRNSKI